MQREHLQSRLGFILLSAGCAIGVGNVWKFPWMVGQYGGGAFVLVYAIFLVILGIPVSCTKKSSSYVSRINPRKKGMEYSWYFLFPWECYTYDVLYGSSRVAFILFLFNGYW